MFKKKRNKGLSEEKNRHVKDTDEKLGGASRACKEGRQTVEERGEAWRGVGERGEAWRSVEERG